MRCAGDARGVSGRRRVRRHSKPGAESTENAMNLLRAEDAAPGARWCSSRDGWASRISRGPARKTSIFSLIKATPRTARTYSAKACSRSGQDGSVPALVRRLVSSGPRRNHVSPSQIRASTAHGDTVSGYWPRRGGAYFALLKSRDKQTSARERESKVRSRYLTPCSEKAPKLEQGNAARRISRRASSTCAPSARPARSSSRA